MNHYLVQASNKAFVFGSSQTAPERNVIQSLAQSGLSASWEAVNVQVFSDDQIPTLKTRAEALKDRGVEVTRLHMDPLTLSK